MDVAPHRHPYRCLPLNIANQNGWFLTCGSSFRVYWYGGLALKDLEIRFEGQPDTNVASHFGNGIITFLLPFIFRTPKGINLWVKGPSNWIKDGVQALEGVVETDWASSTFTMNWKITRPFEWISFEKGDPICMIVPIPRGLTETLIPKIEPIEANPDLHEKYKAWEASRRGFLQALSTHNPEAIKRGWQKDYFQGKTADGGTFEGHQTRLDVRDFNNPDKAPEKPKSLEILE